MVLFSPSSYVEHGCEIFLRMSVCMSVCVCVLATTGNSAKTAEPIKMPSGISPHVSPIGIYTEASPGEYD